MAEELLERVLREIRERKQTAQAAYEESLRLEQALAALGPASGGGAGDGNGPAARSRAAPGANRERIVALVRERPGVTAGDIAHATRIARSTVTTTLGRLVDGGAVERVEVPGGGPGFRVHDGQPERAAAPAPPASDAAAASARAESNSD